MGYFSSGTEGMDFEESVCRRCANYKEPDDGTCPIWMAHLMWNYESCEKGLVDAPHVGAVHGPTLRLMLDHFIPEGNATCAMFTPKDGGAEASTQTEWCPGCRAVPVSIARVNAGGRCPTCETERLARAA